MGTIERFEGTIIGTAHGVTKCRTVTRPRESERWKAGNARKRRGVSWEFVPGRVGLQVPVDVEDHGEQSTMQNMTSHCEGARTNHTFQEKRTISMEQQMVARHVRQFEEEAIPQADWDTAIHRHAVKGSWRRCVRTQNTRNS